MVATKSVARRVLIVEDDFLISEYFQHLCLESGCEVVGVADNAGEALSVFQSSAPDCVLLNVRLRGDCDGVYLARKILKIAPETRIIFITGECEPPEFAGAGSPFTVQTLQKPINPPDLCDALQLG